MFAPRKSPGMHLLPTGLSEFPFCPTETVRNSFQSKSMEKIPLKAQKPRRSRYFASNEMSEMLYAESIARIPFHPRTSVWLMQIGKSPDALFGMKSVAVDSIIIYPHLLYLTLTRSKRICVPSFLPHVQQREWLYLPLEHARPCHLSTK